jgi:hypothetical protein
MNDPAKVQITVATIGLVGVLGGAMIANWDRIFPPPPSPTPRPTATVVGPTPSPEAPATSQADRAAVENVYNLPEARALDIIRAQGFVSVRVLRVCSNSVSAGRVREVIVDNNAPVSDETALMNQYGSTGIDVPLTTCP